MAIVIEGAAHEIRIRWNFGPADPGGRYLGHPQRIPERRFERHQGHMDAAHPGPARARAAAVVLSRAARQRYLTPWPGRWISTIRCSPRRPPSANTRSRPILSNAAKADEKNPK